MPIRIISALLLLLCLISCSSEPAVPLPPSEWIVIGNDLGFRNEFIDMANVVRLQDSSLTVFSVAYPDVALDFPIIEHKVIGSPDKHWRIEKQGLDTLLLIDTVNANRYHLLKLSAYRPTLDLFSHFTSHQFEQKSTWGEQTFSFEGSSAGENNCFVTHGFTNGPRQRDSIRRPLRVKDGFWRIDERFQQPLLLYTRGQGEHYVNIIDSITATGAPIGRLVINSQPNLREMEIGLRPVADTTAHANIALVMDSLRADEQTFTPLIEPSKDERWRSAWNEKELQMALNISDFELEDLRFELRDDQFELVTAEYIVAQGTWSLHPRFPYLVLNNACGNDAFLPLALADDHSLLITLPLRIRLTDRKIPDNPLAADLNLPERIAYSNNAVIFKIPTQAPSK